MHPQGLNKLGKATILSPKNPIVLLKIHPLLKDGTIVSVT